MYRHHILIRAEETSIYSNFNQEYVLKTLDSFIPLLFHFLEIYKFNDLLLLFFMNCLKQPYILSLLIASTVQ